MFAATVGWSHRAALKASLFREEGDGEREKAGADAGVDAAAARPASAVVAVDGEAVLLSSSSPPVSPVSSVARRLGLFRRRGKRRGLWCDRRIQAENLRFCVWPREHTRKFTGPW